MNKIVIADKMQTAKGRLALYAGFWMALAAKMQWKNEGERCPGGVAATDGLNVYYNKENLNARPMGEVVFIALHEIGHPMLGHILRRGNRNPKIANVAMDIVLNKLLANVAKENTGLGMLIPKDALNGDQFGIPAAEVTTFEAVYEKLLKKCKKEGEKGKGKGGKGEPDTSGLPTFDDHLEPSNEDGTPMSGTEKEGLEREWKLSVQAAATMAKQMGKLPGYLEQFVAEIMQPKVDWRAQLRHACVRVARDESSYRRFNRRHVSRGHYLPGQYSERIGAIAYFCDTSGSISTEEFKQGMGEMTAILEDMKPEKIFFGQCDTTLHSVTELKPEDLPLPPLKIEGRGGTDMREAFEWACMHEDEIDAFILQTDGYIPALPPELVPKVPVVWVVTTDAKLPGGCDFGTVVRVVV